MRFQAPFRSLIAPLLVVLPVPQDEPLEGHSYHGEAFNEGPRQAAYLMENPGNVHFPVTSDHPDVQAMFDQGVGQLHGFWYFEAERSFRQVAAWDPDCAMAYWGMAVANFENEERAKQFMEKAWERRAHVSERERMYIDAWARFHGIDVDEPDESEEPEQPPAPVVAEAEPAKDATAAPAGPSGGHGTGAVLGDGNGSGQGDGGGKRRAAEAAAQAAAEPPAEETAEPEGDEEEDEDDGPARIKELIQDIEKIVRAYPDDVEAKAFLVVTCWYGRWFGIEISSKQALQSVLDEVFEVHPNHPAHHYRIHLWDREETSDYVVDSAVASGPSWPTVAHMWHMGGHIFENLGRHRDAAWQQDASARIDHAYMMRDLVLPDQIHNFAHNNEWLVRSLSHVGRVDEALELARNMIQLPRHPAWNLPAKRGTSSFWGRQRLAGVFELFELWEELIETTETGYLAPVEYGEEADEGGDGRIEDAAHLAFALGQAHAYLGHAQEREEQVEKLRALLDEARLARARRLDEAEQEALEADDDAKKAREAMDRVLDEHARPLDSLRDKIAILEALAEVLAADEGEAVEEPLAALEEHGYRESALARLHARAHSFEKAEELARAEVDERPGQAEAYATLAHVLEQADKRDEALAAFEELRAISAELDLSVPTFERLAPLAAAAGHPADWRVPLVVPEDVGARPDLATLGPRRWSPPPAPDWVAADAFGGSQTQADSSGRPRILILFLGFGCAHCVEQLQAFGPAAGDFTAAGIDIVAIGDDPAEDLLKYDLSEYPFPILADPDYEVFRSYRCYDDFEDLPLHGTFLIDADDRIRWQDVSFEPFTDTAFLLGESQRLLGLPSQ